MADDKKKEGDGKEEPGKKKSLSALIFVAAGAAVGGIGVVFAVPPKEVMVEVVEPHYEVVDIIHPDLYELTFNPISKTGRGLASFKFRFVYSVREDLEEEAFKLIEERWHDSQSNLIKILIVRSYEELRTESGIAMLERVVLEDLDRTLFAGHDGEKIAKIERLQWDKILFQ